MVGSCGMLLLECIFVWWVWGVFVWVWLSFVVVGLMGGGGC